MGNIFRKKGPEIQPGNKTDSDKFIHESEKKSEELKQERIHELLQMEDKKKAILLEIKEFAMNELDKTEKLVYLKTTSGQLRLTKDSKGRIYLTGWKEKAEEIIDELEKEYPDKEFVIT